MDARDILHHSEELAKEALGNLGADALQGWLDGDSDDKERDSQQFKMFPTK
jgi:hypothetical protein